MKAPRTIDLHAHTLIEPLESLVRGQSGRTEEIAQQAEWQGQASLRHNAELFRDRYRDALTRTDVRIARMDAMGIDVQAVSLSPTQYYYWADRELARELVHTANEAIAKRCAERPDRLVGLGTVALQFPDLAAEQLRHAVGTLDLRGVQISTRAPNLELGDAALEPLWTAAEETGAAVFIHPLGCPIGTRLDRHYLSNVIGQPLETTIALSCLIFSGTLDRHPDLKIIAAHGGGYLPSYIGRSDHAAKVRPECADLAHPPSSYLRRLHYDTLVYDDLTLRHLLERVGASQLVIGTDYPFDMGIENPLDRLWAQGKLSSAELAMICGENAARLLALPDAQ